jgi:hypothetical protein
MADLDVKRSGCGREAEEKTARAILVSRVVLDDLGRFDRFAQFLDSDVAEKSLIDGVLGEFKLATPELDLDTLEIHHGRDDTPARG